MLNVSCDINLELVVEWQMEDYEDLELYRSQIINKLQDIIEIIIQDVMFDGHK